VLTKMMSCYRIWQSGEDEIDDHCLIEECNPDFAVLKWADLIDLEMDKKGCDVIVYVRDVKTKELTRWSIETSWFPSYHVHRIEV
jgi:hypothetical protein